MSDTYPMRLNKYLAHKNHATRRGADELIADGKVLVNGKVAVVGQKVSEKDVVEVRFKPVKKHCSAVYRVRPRRGSA